MNETFTESRPCHLRRLQGRLPSPEKQGSIGRDPVGGPSFVSAEGSGWPLLDTLPTNEQADELSAKTDRKRRGVSLASRIGSFDRGRAERIRNCGRKYSRAVSKCEHHHTVSLKLKSNYFCQDKLCPECAKRRSIGLVARLSRPLGELQASNGLFTSFLTVTLANSECLPVFADVVRWKKRLLRSKFWREYGLYGTIGTLEVKLGAGSGLWHVHFHLVTFTKRPIPTIETGKHTGEWQLTVNQALSDAWLQANEGSGFIVRGKAFDGNFVELLKYATKGMDSMSDGQLEEFCAWSKGRRFLFLTGKLHANKELKALMQDSDESADDRHCCPECGCKDYERQDFKYDFRLRSYVLERVSDFQFVDTT